MLTLLLCSVPVYPDSVNVAYFYITVKTDIAFGVPSQAAYKYDLIIRFSGPDVFHLSYIWEQY